MHERESEKRNLGIGKEEEAGTGHEEVDVDYDIWKGRTKTFYICSGNLRQSQSPLFISRHGAETQELKAALFSEASKATNQNEDGTSSEILF